MIMIMGSQHDDILYFESIISNKKEETVLGRYKVTIGTIFNQAVILVDSAKTNYLSSALTLYLVEKYFVILVLVVGRCIGFSPDIKPLDIAISRSIIAGDVDQVNEENVKMGQIPGFEQIFECSRDVIGYLFNAFEKRTFSAYKTANYVSTSIDYHDMYQISGIREFDHVLGFENSVVFDCNSAGVAMAASICKVPFVSIKVVERGINDKNNIDTYLSCLKEYVNIGKAVVTCIGDIGSNEVIMEERAE